MRLARTLSTATATATLLAGTLSAAALPASVRSASAAPLADPDISLTNVQAPLSQLQSIATANGGNRYTARRVRRLPRLREGQARRGWLRDVRAERQHLRGREPEPDRGVAGR